MGKCATSFCRARNISGRQNPLPTIVGVGDKFRQSCAPSRCPIFLGHCIASLVSFLRHPACFIVASTCSTLHASLARMFVTQILAATSILSVYGRDVYLSPAMAHGGSMVSCFSSRWHQNSIFVVITASLHCIGFQPFTLCITSVTIGRHDEVHTNVY